MTPPRDTTELIVCTSCGYSDRDTEGRTRGERLQREIARRLDGPADGIEVVGTRCFMACGRGCNVHLRAPGKTSFLIGDLDPLDGDALAMLFEYIDRYRDCDTGVVPYKDWPEGIGKRIICRVPPDPAS